jgi:hypothetical protein
MTGGRCSWSKGGGAETEEKHEEGGVKMKINAHGYALLCYELRCSVMVAVVVDADGMNEYHHA